MFVSLLFSFKGGSPCGSPGGTGVTLPKLPIGIGTGGGGGSSGGGGSRTDDGSCFGCGGPGGYYSTPTEYKALDFCDPCTKAVLDCLVGYTPAGCVYNCASEASQAPGRSAWGNVYGASNCALSCVGGPVYNTFSCIWSIGRDCLGAPFPATPTRRRRSQTSDLERLLPAQAGLRQRRLSTDIENSFQDAMDASHPVRNQLAFRVLIYYGDLYQLNAKNQPVVIPMASHWLEMKDPGWLARAAEFSG